MRFTPLYPMAHPVFAETQLCLAIGIHLLFAGMGGFVSKPVNAQTLVDIPVNKWVKLSPGTGAPPSPKMGYEGDCTWDTQRHLLIRYGGHNQGGGGEQNSELWLFNPKTGRWRLTRPNYQPPGVCCAQQNVFDEATGHYIRFPAFSHSHGWQWMREIYLNRSSVYRFDPARERWFNMRPIPAPFPQALRCASWDTHRDLLVLFGGEGSRDGTWIYEPSSNRWTNQQPATQPSFRSGGNMVYDAKNRKHILFGAQYQDDPHTWAYDVSTNQWTDLQPKTMPPTHANDAVLAYDSIHGVVLAVIKQTSGDEENAKHTLSTWAFDYQQNTWKRLFPEREPDPSGNRCRNLVFAPRWNVALLENRTADEQQIWAYRYADQKGTRTPVHPGGERGGRRPRDTQRPDTFCIQQVVVSVLSERKIHLQWQPLRDGNLRFVVERAPVEVLSTAQLKSLVARTRPLDRPSVGAIRRIGQFKTLTKTPIESNEFIDRKVDLSRPVQLDKDVLFDDPYILDEHLVPDGEPYRFGVFAYRVRVVDPQGDEQSVSPATFTIPSPVEYLFSREDESSCDLRWKPNPEQGIAGYRVYRIDGRWDAVDPVSRLTPEPIKVTKYRDQEAGEQTRRYHVIAVDAIGQEGHPSSPVWYRREWKTFYKPFETEWHQ